jgi:putative ABC transport system substrate-binding protein
VLPDVLLLAADPTRGRRDFVAALGACALAPLFAGAQPAAKIPRIALVNPTVPLADMVGETPADVFTEKFVQRLRELGYVEGRSIAIERRSAEGNVERLGRVMRELVDLRVDAIVTIGNGAMEARRATSTIPIVAYVDDPLRGALTTSLSRPTQNVTGVTLTSDLAFIGKRLQLLKQAAVRSRRVAVIDYVYVDADRTPGTHDRRLAAEAAARELGLTLVFAGINSADDLEQAFAVIDAQHADAMMDIGTPVTWANRRRLIDFAAQRRLPAIYGERTCVEEGGLMSYGRVDAAAPRLAELVDKLLRGATPADLPFEQPTKYELVINLNTAALLGLTISKSLLLAADVLK